MELLLGNYDDSPFEVQDTAFAGVLGVVAAIFDGEGRSS